MGILDYFKGLGLIHVSKVDNVDTNNYIQFLDYIDVVKDVKLGGEITPSKKIIMDDLQDDGFIDPLVRMEYTSLEKEVEMPVISMSLVLNKILVEFKEVELSVKAEEDPSFVVAKHLEREIISKIKEFALETKEAFNKENEKLSTYVEQSGDIIQRKLISKVLSLSNMIAAKGRRGPGTFVIASKKIIDLMSDYNGGFLYKKEVYNITGLTYFVCDELENEVIVGRCGEPDTESSIRLVSNDEALEKNILFNSTDISGIKIKYALETVSPSVKNNYVSFTYVPLEK